jgi:hypothetical protein
MKFLSLLLSAVTISTSAFANNPFDCSTRDTWLQERLNSKSSVENTLSSIGERKTQVVIFGENQGSFPDSSRYPSYVEKLKSKNTDLNCIFIQGEAGYQNILNQYLTQTVSYEQTIGNINQQDKSRPLAHAQKDLMLFAKMNQLKVFAIRTGFSHLRDQNNYMANQISNLFTSNDCNAGVFFIGKDRISMKYSNEYIETTGNPPIVPISNGLTNLQISNSTINLIDRDDESFWDHGWHECSSNIKTPSKDFGFIIPEGETPAIRPALIPNLMPELWSDYDAALSIDTPAIRCNQN